MTTWLIAPAPTVAVTGPAAGLAGGMAGRLRRHTPVAFLPMVLPVVDVAGLATAGLRAAACAALKSAHRRGRLLEPTLIVGTGATAVRVVELLGNHPEFGLAPRGFLDSRLAEQCSPPPLLGEPVELARPVPAGVCVVPRPGEQVSMSSARAAD